MAEEQPDLMPAQVVRIAQESEGFLDLGLFVRARQRARLLMASRAGRVAGLSLMAEALRREGRHEEAVPILEEAVRDFPEEESFWVNLGWCRKRAGRLDLAIEAMEGLLARLPQSPIGHFNLACYLCLAGERERCLGELRLALELEPSFRENLAGESDFDALRGDPEFLALQGP